ncbi:hypothetical protein S40288_01804 [Stachybotrys chartarum IBT 40288]|nr:hypothetical protein S40288_01804 [Stachybotrys chartarum IBT 40288]
MNNRLLLSFYFDFSDLKKQTLDGMLRSLAFQMYQHEVASAAYLDALFQGHRNGRDQPSTNALSDVVCKMLLMEEKISIVLDALDESNTRNELLLWISDITSRLELHHVQLLCTSRPELEFQRKMPKLIGQDRCISIDKNAVNADVRAYVTWQLANREDFNDKNLSKDLMELIQKLVGDGADGMWVYRTRIPATPPSQQKQLTSIGNRFRWAACQMDSLAACPSPRAIKETLEHLPKDLPETYNRMLQSILPDLKPATTRLLQFLIHSQRPLTVPEAVEVIATEIGADSQRFDIDRRVFDSTEVLRYCPGLISIVEAKDHYNIVRAELHLAHFSVKEYLETQVAFKQQSASIIIAQTCLTYLTDITDTSQITQDFPMARFAAKIWTSQGALAEGDNDLFRAILMFLQEEYTFQRWGRLYQADQSWNDDPGPPKGSRLYYACLGGLARVAEELIIKGANVNEQVGEYGNALQAASLRGHHKIVELLLEKGANINAQGSEYINALQAASLRGHDKILELLLEKGANINK